MPYGIHNTVYWCIELLIYSLSYTAASKCVSCTYTRNTQLQVYFFVDYRCNVRLLLALLTVLLSLTALLQIKDIVSRDTMFSYSTASMQLEISNYCLCSLIGVVSVMTGRLLST